MFEPKKEKENLKESGSGFVLRSARDTKVKQKVQPRKLKCHYCGTRDTCVHYLICAKYPNCRRGFCFTCLNSNFASTVDSNPSKFRSQEWICVVCRGLCDCKRCASPEENKVNQVEENFPKATKEKEGEILAVKEWRKKPYLEDEITYKGPKNYCQVEDEDEKKEEELIKQKKRNLNVESSSDSSDYLPNVRNRKKCKRKGLVRKKSLLSKEGKEGDSYKNNLDSKSLHSRKDTKHNLNPYIEAKKGITISASPSSGGKVVLKGLNSAPHGIPSMTQYIPMASRNNILNPAIQLRSPGNFSTYPDSAQIPYTALFHTTAGGSNPNQISPGEHSIGQYSLNYSPALKAVDASSPQIRPGGFPMQYNMTNNDHQAYLYLNPSIPYSQNSYLPLDQNSIMLQGMAYNSYIDPSYYSQEAYANAYGMPTMPQNASFGAMQNKEKVQVKKQKNLSKGNNDDEHVKSKQNFTQYLIEETIDYFFIY